MAESLLMFDAVGPIKVPVVRARNGCYIEAGCRDFWQANPGIANQKGCYVFGIRAGKGITPLYVGKTARCFERECFADHKVARHFNPALARKGRGTPVLFFVVPRVRRGKPNGRIIKDLESFLIQVASVKNPRLSNVQERKEARWGICGVLRGGQGKPNKAARAFKAAVRI
jgi:hypothetical protein